MNCYTMFVSLFGRQATGHWLLMFLLVSLGVSVEAQPVQDSTVKEELRISPEQAITDNNLHIQGRYLIRDQQILLGWPGHVLELQVKGPSLGLELYDPYGVYDVLVNGEPADRWHNPAGMKLVPLSKTVSAVQRVTLLKRTESVSQPARLTAIEIGKETQLLAWQFPKKPQIEFLGDSMTAGYGVEAPSRECSDKALMGYSNAHRAFAALTAQHFGADYQINAVSGRGLVRNWDGRQPGSTYVKDYSRAVLTDPSSAAAWRAQPQVQQWSPDWVVIALGGNDFSTPVKEGERWTQDGLSEAFVDAYVKLLVQLQQQYANAYFVLVMREDGPLDVVDSIYTKLRALDMTDNVRTWRYPAQAYTACHWHPSISEQERIAKRLINFLTPLWQARYVDQSQ